MGFLHLLHYLQFEITLFAFRNSTMSSQPQGETADIPVGLSAANPLCCFLQKVWSTVTPQESACLISVLSCLLPCDRGLVPSLLVIRTHLWLRDCGWEGGIFACLVLFVPEGELSMCVSHDRKQVFSCCFCTLPSPVSSLLYFSACLCFTSCAPRIAAASHIFICPSCPVAKPFLILDCSCLDMFVSAILGH